MKKIKVYFNEFNIPTDNTVYFPYSSGLLLAYCLQYEDVRYNFDFQEFLFRREPVTKILSRYDSPDIVCFSSSIWNHRLNLTVAKELKNRYPNCLIIFGGPQVPLDNSFYIENPFIDVGIFGEGEIVFRDLLLQYLKQDNDFPHHITLKNNITTKEIDIFPSPYSLGLFNNLIKKNQDIKFKAIVETNRSCPFSKIGQSVITFPDRVFRFEEEEYEETIHQNCPIPSHRHRIGKYDKRIANQDKSEALKISFSNGLSIVAGLEHPISKIKNETIIMEEAKFLKQGDFVAIERGQNNVTELAKIPFDTFKASKKEINIKWPKELTEDLAWIIGFTIGDGCISRDNAHMSQISWAVDDTTEPLLLEKFHKVFGFYIKVSALNNTVKCRQAVIRSTCLHRFFRIALGMGSCEEKLKTPKLIRESPKKVVKSFLRGLWEADGYEPRPNILNNRVPSYLTTKSFRLAEDVASLIYWIGDVALVRTVYNRGFYGTATQYRIEWHDEKCDEILMGTLCIRSGIPLPYRIVRPHLIHNKYQSTRPYKETLRNGKEYVCSTRQKLKENFPNHPLLNNRYAYTKIIKIENIGQQIMYDAYVPTNGNKFSANGILVDNCDFCFWGQSDLNKKIVFHSLEYTKQEALWLAQNKVEYIFCADANFGMYKRDLEVAKLFADIKKQYRFPDKFRVCYGKNTTENIFQTAQVLSEANLAKTVTLAKQSNNKDVLANIHRSNINTKTFKELQIKYTNAGIPTYTELILGLPGETYSSFLQGLEEVLESVINNQVFIYHCQILPNTAMAKPDYITKHGLKTVRIPLAEVHGSVRDNSIVQEFEEIVIGTSAMSKDEWQKCAVISWLAQALYGLKAADEIINFLIKEHQIKFTDYFEFIANSDLNEVKLLWSIALDITHGKRRCQHDPKFGNIYYDPEEFIFLLLCLNPNEFFQKLFQITVGFLLSKGIDVKNKFAELLTIFSIQQDNLPSPYDYSSTQEFATKVVLHGRKSNTTKKQRNPIGFQLI